MMQCINISHCSSAIWTRLIFSIIERFIRVLLQVQGKDAVVQIWQIRVSSSISAAQRPKRGELQHLSPFFLATFRHHPWCQVEKNSQQKKIKILDKYILLHSSGHHSRPCCSWKDSSLWQGEQHIPVFCLWPTPPSWEQLQYCTKYMELYPQGQLSACT